MSKSSSSKSVRSSDISYGAAASDNALVLHCPSAAAKHELLTFDNPQPRLPAVLLLDTSYSMSCCIDEDVETYGDPFYRDGREWVMTNGSRSRIDELNAGVAQFFRDVAADPVLRLSVEPCIITFDSTARVSVPFQSFATAGAAAPRQFYANGSTALGAALRLARDVIAKRRAYYKASGLAAYRPWLCVLSDGEPNDDWRGPAAEVRRDAVARKIVSLAVGVGDEAGMDALAELMAPPNRPKRLAGMNFREFFQWLSDSLRSTSNSGSHDVIEVLPTDTWAQPAGGGGGNRTGTAGDDWNF
jgi:uncharacterized protein YegL